MTTTKIEVVYEETIILHGPAVERYVTFGSSLSFCDGGKAGFCGWKYAYLIINHNVFLSQRAARVGVLLVKMCPRYLFSIRDKFGQFAALLR